MREIRHATRHGTSMKSGGVVRGAASRKVTGLQIFVALDKCVIYTS
jgi:hypothetical protein